VVEHGIPPRVILDSASKTDAELIVLGKHAAGIVEKLVVGSVALRVLEQAGCDVLVVSEAS
jgi:nucleotide-binding universal stress UspA family protein